MANAITIIQRKYCDSGLGILGGFGEELVKELDLSR